MSRVYARDTVMKVGNEGLRLIVGLMGDPGGGAAALRVAEIHAAQEGLLDDMDRVCDALYGRTLEA
jgi:hypothetical protein